MYSRDTWRAGGGGGGDSGRGETRRALFFSVLFVRSSFGGRKRLVRESRLMRLMLKEEGRTEGVILSARRADFPEEEEEKDGSEKLSIGTEPFARLIGPSELEV